MNKKTYSVIVSLFAFSILADFVSCSPVQFSKVQIAPQNAGPTIVTPVSCKSGLCTQHHQDTTGGSLPQANILFILDTSGSTTDVQANLTQHLSGFVQGLAGIDYRVGLITTDVSSSVSDSKANYPSAVNGNGALQDGNLVTMSDGNAYLTPASSTTDISVPSITSAANTCISSNYNPSACLSDDPRAIFAANLLVSGNKDNFIREGVPTTFIIISDADERNSTSMATHGYPQGPSDAPSNLIANFSQKFPSTPFQVDALTAGTSSNNSSCFNQRQGRGGNPLIFGFYAPIYANLVQQTGGVLGSICDSNFTNQIGQIASAVPTANQTSSLKFACQPYQGQYTINFTDASGNPVAPVPSTPDLGNLRLNLSSPLLPNVNAVLSYDCEV